MNKMQFGSRYYGKAVSEYPQQIADNNNRTHLLVSAAFESYRITEHCKYNELWSNVFLLLLGIVNHSIRHVATIILG
jgi:CRISPR/Cas system-associated endonuclease Cas3-HD